MFRVSDRNLMPARYTSQPGLVDTDSAFAIGFKSCQLSFSFQTSLYTDLR